MEFDHADIFADIAAIETQFHHFVRTVPRNGLVVSNAGEISLGRVLARGCWTPVERFNEDGSGWAMKGDDCRGSLRLMHGAEEIGCASWALSGEHNRSNALAALLLQRGMREFPWTRGSGHCRALTTSSGGWNCGEWCVE